MSKLKFRNFTKNKDPFFNLFYLMTIGVMIAWVMVTNIVDTTVFERAHFLNLIRVFLVVGLFGIIYRYEVLTKIVFWLFAAFTIFIVTGFMLSVLMPDVTNIATESAEILLRTGHYLIGLRPHSMLYEQVIVWSLILLFSFLVVFFGYIQFRFWVLAAALIITTSIAITSPYIMFYSVFYVFVLCLLTLVVLKSQQLNQKLIEKWIKTNYISKLIIPILAMVVGVAILMPTPPETGTDGFFQRMVRTPFTFVNNVFSDLTTQAEFSLASVGFGGNSGRLGGDVVLNDHVFMQVRTSPGVRIPLYLTGATSNTYTGYSWLNFHSDYQAVDFSNVYQTIEVLERYLAQHLVWYVPRIDGVNSGRFVQTLPWWVHDEYLDFHEGWVVDWLRNYRLFEDPITGVSIQAHIPGYQNTWVQSVDDFSGRTLVPINTLNNRTTSLFHNGIVRGITPFGEELQLTRTRDGRIVTSRRLERETRYRVYHLDFNHPYPLWQLGTMSNPGWNRFSTQNPLQHSYRGVLTDLISMFESFRATHGYYILTPQFRIPNYGVMTYRQIITNFLLPRSEQIHELYLQLPDTLPERVRELAEEVTANATTNYERMVALEAFLSSNFYYTLTPGPSPVGQDFVDHFLFDLQRGYCVHFATAFVVMARALGMPTRYVEGFTIHGEHGWNEYINVLNNMAHAWPEVYFEGYGWVRFEPTPAVAENDVSIPITPDDINNNHLFSGGNNDPEVPETFEPTVPEITTPTTPGQNDDQLPTEVNNDTPDDTRFIIPRLLWIIIGLSMVPIGLFARIKAVKWKKRQLREVDNLERVNYEYQCLLSYLRLFGQDIEPSETEIAFMKRIRRNLELDKHEQAILVTAAYVYTKGRYSIQAITNVELEILTEINARLDEKLLAEVGKVRHYIYQNLIGKF